MSQGQQLYQAFEQIPGGHALGAKPNKVARTGTTRHHTRGYKGNASKLVLYRSQLTFPTQQAKMGKWRTHHLHLDQWAALAKRKQQPPQKLLCPLHSPPSQRHKTRKNRNLQKPNQSKGNNKNNN